MNQVLVYKIKELRKEKKLTLKEVSLKTNLSIGFLSQLENSKTSATLKSVKKISDVLKVNPSMLLSIEEEEEGEAVIEEKKSPTILTRDEMNTSNLKVNSFIYRDLSGDMYDPLFRPTLVILNPKDKRGSYFAHEGQEFIFVLEGTLTILFDEEEFNLQAHDSIFLDSSLSNYYYWLNNTDIPVKFICILAKE